MITLFSQRHRKIIFEKRLKLSLPKRLRRRVFGLFQEFNYSYTYHPMPNDNWTEETDLISDIPGYLKQAYGEQDLFAYDDKGQRAKTNFEGLINSGYPSQVLDSVEVFFNKLPDPKNVAFQKAINQTFEQEESEWRLVDGEFFKMDSEFLTLKQTSKAVEILRSQGFAGALQEFKEAQNDLMGKDFKGAILNSCKCLESTLQTIHKCNSGNASDLIRALPGIGFYKGMPESISKAFGDSVLCSLPFIRNRLGGHGQGENVVSVPQNYAELAIHLAGAFILFLINEHIRLNPQKKVEPAKAPEGIPEDLPF